MTRSAALAALGCLSTAAGMAALDAGVARWIAFALVGGGSSVAWGCVVAAALVARRAAK